MAGRLAIRVAIGATAARVAALALGQAVRLTLVGAAVGLLVSQGLARLIGSQLVGLDPGDIPTRIAVAGALVLAAVLAAAGPAWRAAQSDPATILKESQ